MICRNVTRWIGPVTYQFCTRAFVPQTFLPQGTKHICLPSRPPTYGFVSRFYSQQNNAENLPVVDFEYVKTATSKSEVMIIDVREPDEIKEHGKIPNSVNIPLGTISTALALSEKDFQQTFNRTKPKENTEIIFYCMVGKRSGKAQQTALSLGFSNAKNYIGSWTDWASKVSR